MPRKAGVKVTLKEDEGRALYELFKQMNDGNTLDVLELEGRDQGAIEDIIQQLEELFQANYICLQFCEYRKKGSWEGECNHPSHDSGADYAEEGDYPLCPNYVSRK